MPANGRHAGSRGRRSATRCPSLSGSLRLWEPRRGSISDRPSFAGRSPPPATERRSFGEGSASSARALRGKGFFPSEWMVVQAGPRDIGRPAPPGRLPWPSCRFATEINKKTAGSARRPLIQCVLCTYSLTGLRLEANSASGSRNPFAAIRQKVTPGTGVFGDRVTPSTGLRAQ